MFCLHICLCEGVGFLGIGVTDSRELPCGCIELNPPISPAPPLFKYRVSCSSGWPQMSYGAKDDREFLFYLYLLRARITDLDQPWIVQFIITTK